MRRHCLAATKWALIVGAGLSITMAAADACSPFDATPGGGIDGGIDGGTDSGGSDANGVPNADAEAGSGAVSSCASTRGPTAVDAGTFCIDRTEVSQAQYAQFLADTNGNAGGQIAECGWNDSYQPTCSYSPASTPDLPVVCVDWCDAQAFCHWAHKRLCGGIGGGPTPTNGENNAASSEWFSACTNGGNPSDVYPYGSTYDSTACVGGTGAAAKVGTHPKCVGGVPGLLDMSGNVNEWEDQCGSTGNASADPCRARSGSYNSTPTGLECGSGFTTPRNDVRNGLGFRCCGEQ